MKYQITSEPTEKLELDVQDDRFSLIHRVKGDDGWKVKVIILNKRGALNLYLAIGEEIRGVAVKAL